MGSSFVEHLSDSQPSVVMQALCDLLDESEEQSDLVLIQAVLNLLQHVDETVREYAATVIAEKVVWDNRLAHTFAGALRDESPIVRERVLHYCQKVPHDETLNDLILPILTDAHCILRINAARALWKHSRGSVFIDHIIEEALQSGESNCICEGCQLLCEMRGSGRNHLSSVLTLLRSHEGTVRGNALKALGAVSDDRELLFKHARLLEADADPLVRFLVSQILKKHSGPSD